MKKSTKIMMLCIAIIMFMQVILPTITQAVNLNIQYERPYSDDDGDGNVGNDVYTLVRQAIQAIFKIGEQDAKGDLSFNTAYYCLRGGLGFGSTEEILATGVEYSKIADLSDAETVIAYFKDTLGITNETIEVNYNAVCWIANNMYLPKSEHAEELKQNLLTNAGITSSLLTDDDIEVVQQIALWYFTNYDENGEENSVSLDKNVDLANLLQINNTQPENDLTVAYNKNRAKQINTLYEYFINNATTQEDISETKVPEKLELDKNLEPVIKQVTVPETTVNAYVVGPFKINEVQKGNIDYTFSHTLNYKTKTTEEEWQALEIDNTLNTVYISDVSGNVLEESKEIKDMVAADSFYITVLKDVLDIPSMEEFSLSINYDSYYYKTVAEVLVATAEDQPVLKVEKEKITNPGIDTVTIKPNFDLALRKYISNIERNGEKVEFASRVPQVDTTPLTQNKTTANYIHPKNVLTVKQGDIITYKLRIYNEGNIDGYATEITDYIPEGLGLLVGYSGNDSWLIKSETKKPQPLVGEEGIYKTQEDVPTNGIFKNEDLSKIEVVTGKEGTLEIRDSYSLKEKLIKKYGSEQKEDLFQVSINNEEDGLFYQEVEVTCIVIAPNTYEKTITNIAEISEDKAVEITINENNQEVETEIAVEDRDSQVGNVLEDGKHVPGNEEKGYTPGEQDDDDFEPVQLRYFDLALRKFITGVNDEEVKTRIPEFKIDEDGNYVYNHDKTPVEVVDNDNVTYTIRVFNEGTIAGYAEELEDDIPEGLIFLPEDETNKAYGWKMYYYDEAGKLVETEKEEEAQVIRTTYLSEANGTVDETTGKNSNLLEVFNKQTMETPDFRDVKVVFKVSQKDIPEENKDGIIINKAHITEDSDDDEDSKTNKWNEGEDDQDKEYIYVQKFDLALFKWVTKTIVTVDGKTTTTETGFKPNIGKTEASGEEYRQNSEEEPIASVTIDKKKLKSTVVKFVYNIKVVNEGDVPGYATEVTDYIPEGLKFVTEDNPLWALTEEGKITTRALEKTLLQPGESAEIPVTFTWINDSNNLGLKTNIAAITEDYNEKGVPDEDSIPGNEDIPNYEKEQEDDDDFALVILTLKTGETTSYVWLMIVTIMIIATGAILVKKYAL